MGLHLLDRVIGDEWPSLASDAEVRAFESIPYEERIAAQSTYDALRLGAEHDPECPALHFLANASPDEEPLTITHGEFHARVTQVANMLHTLGVGPTDVVSLLLPLVPQAFVALYGAQAAGIANPVNAYLEAGHIAHILRAAKTKVLIALAPREGYDIWDKVARIRKELPELKAILVVGRCGPMKGIEHDFDALADREPRDRLTSGRRIDASDVGALFHTGGTTGLPQLVPLTHGNQVYQAWGMAMMFRTKPGNTLLMGLPLFHVGGALTQGLQHLSAGGTLVVLSAAGWRNKNAMPSIWKLVERYKPELLGGVPTVLGAVLNVPMDGRDVSSIRKATGGGSAIPVPIADAYRNRFGIPILETYGMTEASSCHTISYADRPVYLGSVGHPLPYSRVRVVEVDDKGKFRGECAPGRIGVVTMWGPGVFTGYATGAPDAPFVEPGWVNSGDLGRVDANGYLWITGRAKDLVIRGGHNIDPTSIEEILYQHPAVAVAAVVGEPDAYAGELPVAFVQLKEDFADADPKQILAYAAARTPERAAVPVQLYVVDTIPLTAVGKVFKPALRLQAAERAVRRLLALLEKDGCTVDVNVASHKEHGTLIGVTLSGEPAGGREAALVLAKARLDPLTMKHELRWLEEVATA
ncbi:acyl-CoA synthetase [Ramlibacter sp.]|uniref:acyl-CoA synthetase n=1 Tax=Ramlibacter sp. TaxID=1917967 RepID=UPI003D148B99